MFLCCGELCSTDAPCARDKEFPAHPSLQERSNFHVGGVSILAVLQAEPWHAEMSRVGEKPYLSRHLGEQGARH